MNFRLEFNVAYFAEPSHRWLQYSMQDRTWTVYKVQAVQAINIKYFTLLRMSSFLAPVCALDSILVPKLRSVLNAMPRISRLSGTKIQKKRVRSSGFLFTEKTKLSTVCVLMALKLTILVSPHWMRRLKVEFVASSMACLNEQISPTWPRSVGILLTEVFFSIPACKTLSKVYDIKMARSVPYLSVASP